MWVRSRHRDLGLVVIKLVLRLGVVRPLSWVGQHVAIGMPTEAVQPPGSRTCLRSKMELVPRRSMPARREEGADDVFAAGRAELSGGLHSFCSPPAAFPGYNSPHT